MKDSGVQWIGEIPEHTDLINNKYLLAYVKGRNPTLLYNEQIGLPYIGASDLEENGNCSYNNYCSEDLPMAKKDDVLVLWDGARAGLIGTGHGGYISSTIVKVMPKVDYIDKRFWYWYLKGFQPILLDWVGGTTIPHMNRKYINDIFFVRFPLHEQQKIANFLDQKVSQIDHIIEKTKEAIGEYKKYKQSLITETVTKGLNPDVEMKDSGIEWIGEIPEHWDTKKLKYVTRLNQKTLKENTNDNYVFRYVDIGSVTFENGIEKYERMQFKGSPSRARRIVTSGDIIISTVRTYLKAITSIDDDDDVIVSTGFAVLTPFDIAHKYLEFYSKCSPFGELITAHSDGVSYPAINASDILKFKITIPPKEEQLQIADFLDSKCTEIDVLIDQKEKLITELESYKKSLIYEYVTGKRQVV